MYFSQRKRLFDFKSLDQVKYVLNYLNDTQSTFYRDKKMQMTSDEFYSEYTESGISYYGWEVMFLAELESKASVYLNRIETHEKKLKQKEEQEVYKNLLYDDIARRNQQDVWHGKLDEIGRRLITYRYQVSPVSKLPKFNFQQEGEDYWGGQRGLTWAFFISRYYDALIYPIFLSALDALASENVLFFNKAEIDFLENPPQKALFKVIKYSI
jgi:hypothetical protein